jgi:hypothetical protein
MHKWLAGDAAAARTATIEARRYEAMRNRLRDKYNVSMQAILLIPNRHWLGLRWGQMRNGFGHKEVVSIFCGK